VRVDALMGDARVAVVRGGDEPHDIEGAPGSLITLLPVGGTACGITTQGLEYPLAGEDLPVGTSRGVSNVLVGSCATVTLASGTLLVVQPEGTVR
jgi:thiamine pyrophosphokinase